MTRPIFLVQLGITLGVLCFAVRPGESACDYFRVGMKLARCAAATPQEIKALQTSAQEADDPDLKETDDGPLARILCSCSYALEGSNPLCDFDKTEEQTSYLSATDIHQTCARGNNLCEVICQKQISN